MLYQNSFNCLPEVLAFAYLQYYHVHLDYTPYAHLPPSLHLFLPLWCADGYDIILLNFYADWCRFSQQLKPIFEKAAETMAAELSVRDYNIIQTPVMW